MRTSTHAAISAFASMATIFRDRGSYYDWFVTAMAVLVQSPDLKREGKVKKSLDDIAKDEEGR